MKRFIFGALFIAVCAACVSLPTAARGPIVRLQIENTTRDAWVWVTPRANGKNQGAWCVNPGQTSVRDYNTWVYEALVEVTAKSGCLHPRYMIRTIGLPGKNVNPKRPFIQITGSGGKYNIRNWNGS